MWKLLPVLFLVSCAAIDPQRPNNGDSGSAQGRIVRQVELPLQPVAQNLSGEASKKSFQRSGIQGWLDNKGVWQIRTEVHHSRLRCGTYRVGIQLGKGSPVCTNVAWLTDVEYVTRQLQCNSASRPHAGGSRFSNATKLFKEVTCVRVVVRCEGAC
jgi:hypothetical protein